VCALAIGAAACHGERAPSSLDASAPGGLEGALQAPAGLLLDAVFHDPDAAWARIRRGAGGAFALFPTTLGELACAALGVDASLGALVDGHAAAYAAVVRRPSGEARPRADAPAGEIGWAVALRLTDDGVRRIAGMSLSGAGFTERVEGGIRVLTRPGRPSPAAIGIAQRWLVIARDERDLLDSGPYVFRTLPMEAALASSASFVAIVSHRALVGPVSAYLSSRWEAGRAWLLEQGAAERDRHGGRRPDFGDPEAIVSTLEAASRRRLASLADAREVRVEGEAGADDLTVDVHAVMGDASASVMGDASASVMGDASASVMGDASASTPLGDASPLRNVPSDAPLALLVRDGPEERAMASHDATVAFAQALGSRLGDGDVQAIGAALGDWARGRGDWMSIGVAPEGGLWVRAPAVREEEASRGVREVLELSRVPALRAPLADWFRRLPVVFGPKAAAASMATTATFAATGDPAGRSPLGVAWEAFAGEVTIGVGARPLDRLADVTSPRARWGDDARMARVLAGLGALTTFAVVAQPLRFDSAARSTASAPLALAWGRQGPDPCARIDIADELLVAGVRFGAGF
jgi:hypothetical protein